MGDLYVGERLLLSDGHEAVVDSLQREYAPAIFENWTPGKASTGTPGTPTDPQTGIFTTYNFEVADWHTYFVGEVGNAVWVHNTGALCPKIIEAATRKPELVNKMGLHPQVRRQLEDKGLLPRKWPGSPDGMDRMLGVQGTRVPDSPSTPGRNKVVWQPNEHTKITFEQHPYHPNAPEWHKGPHWHLDTLAERHKRFLPGEPLPGQ